MQAENGQCATTRQDADNTVCGDATDNTARESTVVTVGLMPLDTTDNAIIRSWRNDYRVWQWCRQYDFISDAAQARWYDAQSKDPTIAMYKLVVAQRTCGDKPRADIVGVCGLTSIDHKNRRAEFSLYIAPHLHGMGWGRKGLELLLTHGFSNLGLNVIWGEVFHGNPAAKLFRRLGFVKEGTRRQFYFRDGAFIDADIVSLTAAEWQQYAPRTVIAPATELCP